MSALSSEQIAEIADDVAVHVMHHIREMYPAALTAIPKCGTASIRNCIKSNVGRFINEAQADTLDTSIPAAKSYASSERVDSGADDRRDAARYRWLQAEHQRHDPLCHLSWKRNADRNGSEWVNTADLDAAIDAAMTGATGKETK